MADQARAGASSPPAVGPRTDKQVPCSSPVEQLVKVKDQKLEAMGQKLQRYGIS
jgi:hypothetical protein